MPGTSVIAIHGSLVACLLALAAAPATPARHPGGLLRAHHPRVQTGPVRTASQAMRIAEAEVGGQAVDAHKIPLNGASAGWEVRVHLPGEREGWRCIVDADSRSVYRKERIPNPPPPAPSGKR